MCCVSVPGTVPIDILENEYKKKMKIKTFPLISVKLGIKHPDSVVETSSLSSVEPQNVWYNPSIPESTIDYGHLSALQLESIVYAAQRHETFLPSGERAGFLIGELLFMF